MQTPRQLLKRWSRLTWAGSQRRGALTLPLTGGWAWLPPQIPPARAARTASAATAAAAMTVRVTAAAVARVTAVGLTAVVRWTPL